MEFFRVTIRHLESMRRDEIKREADVERRCVDFSTIDPEYALLK